MASRSDKRSLVTFSPESRTLYSNDKGLVKDLYTLKRLYLTVQSESGEFAAEKDVPDDKVKLLEECWAALNLWVLASLRKEKVQTYLILPVFLRNCLRF